MYDANGQTAPLMTDKELKQFSEFIYSELGIKITQTKKTMLQARLQRRLRTLNMKSYGQYLEYLQSLKGLEVELPQMVDAVTTNTTSFFREPKHFEYLSQIILPQWQKKHPGRTFAVWNAGCSSGEEPYTTAMTLMDYHQRVSPLRFTIVATDISTDILKKAARAVYEDEKIGTIPVEFRRKFLLRSKDKSRRMVRIIPELRDTVSFRRLNFMDDFQFREKMDLIFCRNVMIYFDKKTQNELVQKFCNHLEPGGYLFIGHSESLAGTDLPLKQLAPATYMRI
ncbi:protein-glutamate O-methyltransferase [Desulfomicrobium sp. ZS1]|jgi:chemotaxis protein methyltransferase CheR|uniref:CheR family methyltransferase n=1 Tax=Desulfomicrobium sp. ZS1 TaxID=2952228 RepID=UPI0020B1D257|nr:protein-glutamate O-methyltransferase [Desulfomicrobium sp. ZS1]UTF51563.1 protein-glutamate O-methyltransferase [Desulfomicrobium sp. ZS1]